MSCGCKGRKSDQEISNAEPVEGIQRLLGIQFQGQPADLSRTVGPTVQLADVGDDAQFFYLYRRMRFAFGAQLAGAGAGLDRVFCLTNPAGSGVLARVEYAAVQNLSGATTFVGGVLNRGTLVTGVQVFGVNLDGRQPVTGIAPVASAIRLDAAGQATGALPQWSRSITNNGLVSFPAPIIVTPGTQLLLHGIGNNLTFGFECIWTERRMYPEERQ